MVNLNCFFLLLLIAYFYLKLTEDLFTITSADRMIKKKFHPAATPETMIFFILAQWNFMHKYILFLDILYNILRSCNIEISTQ